jgi:hypothetical protein
VIQPANHVLLASDEAPGDHCVFKLLGITMDNFWKVLLECKLVMKRGNNNVLEKSLIKKFITDNELADVLLDGESNKQPTTRLGFANHDLLAAEQWRSKMKPPSPL